jgi:hypothetical protein
MALELTDLTDDERLALAAPLARVVEADETLSESALAARSRPVPRTNPGRAECA